MVKKKLSVNYRASLVCYHFVFRTSPCYTCRFVMSLTSANLTPDSKVWFCQCLEVSVKHSLWENSLLVTRLTVKGCDCMYMVLVLDSLPSENLSGNLFEFFFFFALSADMLATTSCLCHPMPWVRRRLTWVRQSGGCWPAQKLSIFF